MIKIDVFKRINYKPGRYCTKLWDYCNVLRDDGMSYGDYVEQLTYLLFLKMADERAKLRINSRP